MRSSLHFRGLCVSLLCLCPASLALAQDPEPVPPASPPAAAVAVPPKPLFVPPEGLTKPVEKLLWELGYQDAPTPQCIPFGYRFCMEVAVKCHVQRRYVDSLAFVRRALELRETPAALYLKALDELATNRCDDAVETVLKFKATVTGRSDIEWLREKLSSPLTVRLNDLFEEL